jgi:hypothetical protein
MDSSPTLPPEAKPNLVLGMVHNYSWEELRPFLVSLRQSGYSDEIVLFYHRIGRKTMDAIRARDVTLLPFRNLRGNFRSGNARKALNFLSQKYYRAKWPFYSVGWPLLLSPAKQRFLLFHRFLRDHGHRYRRVLLTDTRDVFFQRDPFVEDPGDDLIFFEEGQPLAQGMFNPLWIIHHLGHAALTRLGAKPTLCSGTILGRPEALDCYLSRLVQLMSEADRMDFATGDQALHNAVVYEGLDRIPFSVRRSPNGAGSVYTLSRYLHRTKIAQSPSGDVVNECGQVVPILHQYDRHPDLQRVLLGKLFPP